MFKRLRDGNLALGLVIGIFAVILFELFAEDYLGSSFNESTAKNNVEQTSQVDKQSDKQNANPYLLARWARKLVSFEDSIAQWLMMVFSVAAFWVLLKTLEATREIGKAQTRAYLSVQSIEMVEFSTKDNTLSISAEIKNIGSSPARYVALKLDLIGLFNVPKANKNFNGDIDTQDIPAGHTERTASALYGLGVGLEDIFRSDGAIVWICNAELHWEDVFKEKQTQMQKFSVWFEMVDGKFVGKFDVFPSAADDRHKKRKDKQ